MKIAVIILAAGKSSRMGTIKQLLKIGGKTLIGNAIESANNSTASTVFCVLGANATQIEKEIQHQEVELVFNKNYEKGLGTSIVSGIESIENHSLNFDAILIMLADQPEVDANYLNTLINLYQDNSEKIIASSYNQNIGVPVVFPKKHFSKLQLLNGDTGAKEFLKLHQSETIKLHRNKPFVDLDTQEEYEDYLKRDPSLC